MSNHQITPLQLELSNAINRASAENGSNTPDFILARYLEACLNAFNTAVLQRKAWYGPTAEMPPQTTAAPAQEPAPLDRDPIPPYEKARQTSIQALVNTLETTAGHLEKAEGSLGFHLAANHINEAANVLRKLLL